MTDETKTGGPAFPPYHDPQNHASGMTLRDYFAAQALQGILAEYWGNEVMGGLSPAMVAENAYQVADAMLEAREKEGEG